MARDIPRLVRLLWRDDEARASARGRPARMSVDDLVDAGIALADREGLAGLTMRAVAAGLGTAPMSLYAHVPDKEALTALMSDRVLARMAHADYDRIDDWRARLGELAADNRRVHLAHPWLASLGPERTPIGPGAIAKYERELRALAPLGLGPVDTDACLTLLVDFARSSARAEQAWTTPDPGWWESAAPVLARHVTPERFPLATRIGQAAGELHGAAYDDEHAWRFGLARLIDGIAALTTPPPAVPGD